MSNQSLKVKLYYILTPCAAIVALCISIWGSWFREVIFPFKLVGNIGAYITLAPLENQKFLSIAVPVTLSNVGEESGYVFDLCLKLKSTNMETEWIFFPANVLKTSMISSKGKMEIEGPWATVYLRGRQAFNKSILFLHRPAGTGSDQRLAKDIKQAIKLSDLDSTDTYKIELNTLKSDECILPDKPDYEPFFSDSIKFKETVLRPLMAEQVPYIAIPYNKLDEIRENFIMK